MSGGLLKCFSFSFFDSSGIFFIFLSNDNIMAPAAKRKRGGNTTVSGGAKYIRQKIRTLEAGLSDKSNLNNIVEITKYTKSNNAQIAHAAIHSLNRVYTSLLMAGDLKKLKNVDESSAKAKVNAWLREQYSDYLAHVRGLLSSDEPGL